MGDGNDPSPNAPKPATYGQGVFFVQVRTPDGGDSAVSFHEGVCVQESPGHPWNGASFELTLRKDGLMGIEIEATPEHPEMVVGVLSVRQIQDAIFEKLKATAQTGQ